MMPVDKETSHFGPLKSEHGDAANAAPQHAVAANALMTMQFASKRLAIERLEFIFASSVSLNHYAWPIRFASGRVPELFAIGRGQPAVIGVSSLRGTNRRIRCRRSLRR